MKNAPPQYERMAAAVRAARSRSHSEEQALRHVEAAATVDPVGAAERLVGFADLEQRQCTQDVRRHFGIEVRATVGDTRAFVVDISGDRIRFAGRGGYKPIAALSIVRPECLPQTFIEETYLDHLLVSYEIADLAHRAMLEIGWDVKEAGHGVEDMSWAMCQVFVVLYRHRFVFSGTFMTDSGLHPELRKWHTVQMAGWVGSKISLEKNKRL
ncbi:MAG TPA: hypothetical protein VFJ72_10910, partial [Rubrobacteraceae bacterium]|nr:hypothetical protein [Rubrobacteraceae bacterium]